MTETGAGIVDRLFPSEETKLLRKEQNSLSNLYNAWKKYGHRFKMPPESTPIADLYRLTQEIGYKVREVGLGAKYIDIHGKTQEITRDNSCRIGKGNVLYVGVYEPGSPYDRSDLCHDVGACLTGGKIIKKDCVPYIRINTFNQVTQLSAGKTFSLGELSEKNLLDPNDNTRIPDTYIFDAILAGDIEASMISSSSRVR